MGMRQTILDFAKQFDYQPAVEGDQLSGQFEYYRVIGMGGSGLAGKIIQALYPEIDIAVRSDYGLPYVSPARKSATAVIASSYSGNTEETIAGYKEALEKEIQIISIATGGELINLSRKFKTPYILLPDFKIQPRAALGFSLRAHLKALGREEDIEKMSALSKVLKPENLEYEGKQLAEMLKGYVPVIYSSNSNRAAAYNWKIKFNETGKIPAFYNVFPELNHNEMTGFDVKPSSKTLSLPFKFILLRDETDNPSVMRRMDVLKSLYEDRKLPIITVPMKGNDKYERLFSSLILADWTAFYAAENLGLESEQVPMVEEFKKLIG